ncbi:MAG: thiamine pyrophosphate-dependent enzyme [Saprospiraceae bacterium]|nr:thiamine pyrophosphate-dependent enzyme [Saprospiraceae bacterium]MDW8484323.1 thiamine pyrophosphate-dependent enzyme [Saprospiraceae bacterium]
MTSPAISDAYRQEVLRDYRICCISREASILARKEVLTGKANFGIIGDGKEVAQVAMAKAWRKGDFRAGYYRDQTLMFALGLMTLEEFFGQLYGDPENDPFSGGRQMNCHFATPFLEENGAWLDLKNRFNISSDVSPTGGQMARALGLAFASKKFRENPALCGQLSDNGNEVVFCTIGDASTSEGVFWETLNAAGVLQVPLAISVWDDGYGISVPKKYQTTKESISEAASGFEGAVDIYRAKGWDYPGLCRLYTEAIQSMRQTHRPALFHIEEMTQQLGHSTSGDHRRYKSAERLAYEEEYDCNRRMAQWMLETGIATEEEIAAIQAEAKTEVMAAAHRAYRHYHDAVEVQRKNLRTMLRAAAETYPHLGPIAQLANEIDHLRQPLRFELLRLARRALYALASQQHPVRNQIIDFVRAETQLGRRWYSTHLYSQTHRSALNVPVEPARFSENSPLKDGYEILNACFDANFARYPELFAFGEDVGHIGDVNQGMRGMQQKYGIERVFDTGIREWTIVGQAIGMAMRGLRPIAEIQYLDYLLYGLPALSDDLATVRWRSANRQAAPAIIRTRGHRLVGIWHSGSPIGMMLGSLRGIYLCVPRNMTQAAGMYNTLLQSDDPAIVIECLNGYRLKERLPDNIGTFTVPLGVPEIIRLGTDVTLITYGSCVRVAEEACELLAHQGISVELIDVQTLLPFDLPHLCLKSIQKTNRVVFLDEDFKGGASAYMLQQVLETQGAYRYLDSAPVTITAPDHRPAYGQDGDYFSKPQVEDVFEAIYLLMRECEPAKFPPLH